MKTHKTDGKLPQGSVFFTASKRMDVDIYRISHGVFPPAMFQGFSNLEAWTKERGFEIKKLEGFSTNEVVNVLDPHGSYDGIWVAATNEKYRDAMFAHAKLHGTCEADLKEIDADHVINRACLIVGMTDVWLALMPVGKSSNRSFGVSIEKKLQKVDISTIRIDIGPLQIMKIFLVQSPTDKQDMEFKIREIAGQLQDGVGKDCLIDKIREAYEIDRGWRTT